jgi:predicted nucleotidyltransferase component of viral defense system
VQRYAVESGLRDIMIAEKEVVLTFLLQLLSERCILNRLAFKGGTCLRKMFVGSQGRFSTDTSASLSHQVKYLAVTTSEL